MNRISIAVICMTAFMLSACTFNATGRKTTRPSRRVNTVKKQVARTWHVGGFTVSTHLLPKIYDPHGSDNFMDLESSALFYVPKSTPTEVVAQSFSTGRTHVVARVDCLATWQGMPTQVHSAAYPYLLVQCGNPRGNLNGILVDAKTGRTWTLWTDGQAGTDGALDGGAVVSTGWVYFETSTTKFGPVNLQRAMNLTTGVTNPLPFPLRPYFAGYIAPDGTLYGMQWKRPTSADLYRVHGLESTLVAHFPVDPENGFDSMVSIDANGTIWVSKPGGTLAPDAGAMTIRVSHPTPAPPKSKVLWRGIGYVVSLGTAPSPYAERPVQVTLATSQGAKTIVVGKALDVQDDVGITPDGSMSEVVFFPAPHGRWQVVTVAGGNSP